MDFYTNVKKIENELGKFLAKHNLLHDFKTDTYPITLTITQDRSPEAQMEIFDTADGEVSSSDAVIRFKFNLEGTAFRTDERFVIKVDDYNKIKSLAVKLFHAYIEGYYAERRHPAKLCLYGDPDLSPEETEGDFSGFCGDDEAENE